MDAAKKMKLWKIEITVAAFYHRKSKSPYPASSISFEMRELPETIPADVLFYLNWYKDVVQWAGKSS